MAELYLVEFKGSRKEFFFNSYYHNLVELDHVIVQAERGEDIGMLLHKVEADIDFSDRDKPRSILRPANDEDLSTLTGIREKEDQYRSEVIELIAKHSLKMKVVDVECQYDGNKMTVYFTADHRVDFRDLVKDLAGRYRTRIELRQIGVRDEARRLGGFGICGRRQCCSSFIRDFEPISTQHAREQDLPLNPAKISGNCGRLLCCLRYEVDLYTTCKGRFPGIGAHITSKTGESGNIERSDVFKTEAVVRDQENRLFRCSLENIVRTPGGPGAGGGRKPSPKPAPGKNKPDDRETEEALKKLDNNDNGN